MSPSRSPAKDRSSPLQVAIQASQRKADAQATSHAAANIYAGLIFLYVMAVFLVIGSAEGVLNYYIALLQGLSHAQIPSILTVLAFPVVWVLTTRGVHEYRHRNDVLPIALPDYPPLPDLRFENTLYIGSGWTYDGKQPGDILEPDETVLEPHVILQENGLFGNIHIKGGVGSGKTATYVNPVIDQAISKFPKPQPPSFFANGNPVTIAEPQSDDGYAWHTYAPSRDSWNPYVGLSPAEAEIVYQDLCAEHERRKWGALIFDAKGDITDFVRRCCIAAGREDDLIVLRPDAEWTYNPLAINANPLVMAEMVMDGIEAVAGQTSQHYWRTTQSEWLANALSILHAAAPAKVTFQTLLSMARKEDLRTRYVNEATAKLRELQEAEESARRLGQEWVGERINPAAIEFFQDWDDVESDPSMKRSVVSGIKAQSKFFVDGELSPFLCPVMPPTFAGFEEAIDSGKIVVLQMPIDKYGTVGRVLGILLLADFQAAALSRLSNDSRINRERVFLLMVDEVANYLNSETNKFISMNRQARVCCAFAHQSQGQIILGGNKSFETSFNDNLRTKVSFSAPNAEAGNRESQLFGSRRLVRERYSESAALQAIHHTDGGARLTHDGSQNQSATSSFDEAYEAWFTGDDFTGLSIGQCIVSEFDGMTTLTPRLVHAPLFWKTARGKRLASFPLSARLRSPHPVLRFGENPHREIEYVDTALSKTGFVIIHRLLDRTNGLRGFRFVSEAGTVVVSTDDMANIDELSTRIADRLGDSHCVALLVDGAQTGTILADLTGLRFDRVLPYPAFLTAKAGDDGRRILDVLPDDIDALSLFENFVEGLTGTKCLPIGTGSFETFYSMPLHGPESLEEDGRILVQWYRLLGVHLLKLQGDALEDVFDAFADLSFLPEADPAPSEDPAQQRPKRPSRKKKTHTDADAPLFTMESLESLIEDDGLMQDSASATPKSDEEAISGAPEASDASISSESTPPDEDSADPLQGPDPHRPDEDRWGDDLSDRLPDSESTDFFDLDSIVDEDREEDDDNDS